MWSDLCKKGEKREKMAHRPSFEEQLSEDRDHNTGRNR